MKIEGADAQRAMVIPTALCNPVWSLERSQCPATGVAHIILAVTDTGAPSLTSYRRVILNVHSKAAHE